RIAAISGEISVGSIEPPGKAICETEEEIGLAGSFVETVGRLPNYLASTGFRITPVLGVVTPGFALTLNPAEVDDVFE
ncbi:CoA pyrophosphatase, partial [Rhizobium ruizarguesonis]